ncbi:hypothetical protein SAMN00120144_4359 [Hymenobacter roseosalivarius DSM 11622]|uniref:Antitoxin VbhA domain-containing protein n=1 Tax=Hymenobacter roseosalivarius DSM 11622 TaxID=645990 RepID=A0A1W1W4P4_9BACT|nr:hypothetical protein [Hymenobacter roseosalivarius]SMC00598.1 hypothetical protein SAMN00120144_4359 [Hymenobacter roseosalivarius DSM 11622]
MPTLDFTPISPDLPAAEQEARRKRQHHAEWGVAVAVARLGKADVTPAMLQDLQRYIDGELSLEALEALGEPTSPAARVLAATVSRARFAR